MLTGASDGGKRRHWARVQLTDLKIAFKGSAKVDHEVKERRDGSLLVKYISHMSGDVIINLVCFYFPIFLFSTRSL